MSLLFHFCCVRCLPCTDEERDRGGQDPERLEAQTASQRESPGRGWRRGELHQTEAKADTEVHAEQGDAKDAAERDQDTG